MPRSSDWTSLIRGRGSIAHDDEVITWVEKMLIRRKKRDEIVAASRNETDGWPSLRADGTKRKPLTDGGVFGIRCVIAYQERMAGNGSKREENSLAARIAAARRLEKEAGTTSRAHWIKERTRIIELGMHILRIEPMVYWSKDAVPDDELEDVYDRAVATLDALKRLVGAIDTQRGDKRLRDKIKSLRAKADSTLALGNPEEADSFYRKAAELEDGLDQAA